MSIDPRVQFPNFYGNAAIKALSGESRWTISGRLVDSADTLKARKAPIDVRHLIDTGGRVRGAWARDRQCLVSLDELTVQVPQAANAAFYLQALTDGLMVIDIEPDCPPAVAHNILALPGALYSEVSMSGRGYHLVVPLPENFHDFPIATAKKVIREEHGWYEILLDHWATFTRKPVSDGAVTEAAAVDLATAPFGSMDDLYASLAKTAKASRAASGDVGVLSEEAPKIVGMGRIIRQALADATPRFKTLDDFNGDRSRYEFSVLGTLYRQICLQAAYVGNHRETTYSTSDRAWLLYLAAQEVLPSRLKHNERRNGRPFLLDRAAAMVAMQSNHN